MKRVVYLVTIFLLCMVKLAAQTAWNGRTEDFTKDHMGTLEDPYQISNAEQLAYMAKLIVDGTDDFATNYIILIADLDLGGASQPPQQWIPIGTSTMPFAGHFDGQGHTISNLYIGGDNDYVGLFGSITRPSTGNWAPYIKNLGIIGNSSVSGGKYVGAIAGVLNGYVEDCYNTGTVNGVNSVGGIVGLTSNFLTSINRCFNLGDITGTGNITGGIGGDVAIPIKDSYNMGKIVGLSGVGGIAGKSTSGLVDCYNAGDVVGSGINVASLVGESNNNVDPRGCVSDKQMCSQKLLMTAVSNLYINSAKSHLTSRMTNGKAFEHVAAFQDPGTIWNTDVWEFTAGMYPRLKATKDLPIVKLYATPLTFATTNDNIYESINNVSSAFKMSTTNGVTWSSSKTSLISISGGDATITRPSAVPDNATITATSGVFTKKIALRVLPQPFIMTINNPANCTITVMDGEDVVANGGKVEYGRKVNLYVETADGYMLERFMVDGKNVDVDNIIVTANTTISAIVVAATANVWDGTSAVMFGEGFGTEAKPYLIYTPQQLALLANNVAFGTGYAGVHFKLANEINLGGKATIPQQWKPIGTQNGGIIFAFKGVFDGNNKYISDLYINSSVGQYLGLFGYLFTGAEVRNVYLKSGFIACNAMTGGIVGNNSAGTIKNCFSLVDITGGMSIGGIVGYNTGIIDGCVNLGNITGTANNVGGIVGYNAMGMPSEIRNSYNSGRVVSSVSAQYLGGVAGRCDANITNCYNTGSVEGGSGRVGGKVGGVAGNCLGSFTKCFFDKQICTQLRAIDSFADSDKAKGVITSVMTTAIFDNSADVWSFETGMYPRLKSILNDITLLYATPIYLHTEGTDDDVIYNVYNMIKKNFTVGVTGGVAWTSNDEALVINGAIATINQAKSRYNDINLTATISGSESSSISRDLKVKVYPLEVTITIAAADNGVFMVMNGKTVVKSGDNLPVYSQLTIVATPNNGYSLDSFTVNGVDIHGNSFLLTEESTILAKFVKVGDVKAWDGTIAKFFGGGTGAMATPYLIFTAEQLAYLASTVNLGNSYLDQYFRIMSNIDLGGQNTQAKNWTPIGDRDNSFAGNVDGNGKMILNLNIDRTDSDNIGLFGYTVYGFDLNKLGVAGVSTVNGKDNVGALVGFNGGKMTNCFSKAKVTGEIGVGGLVGNQNASSVLSCYNRGTITGTKSVGGVIGINDASLSFGYSDGAVSGTSYVGAVVGMNGSYSGSGKYVSSFFYDSTKLTIKGFGGETVSTDVDTQVNGKSTAEMTDGTFANTLKGWLNPNPWREDFSTNAINNKYPVLSWEIVKITIGTIENGSIAINGTTREAEYSEDFANGSELTLKATANSGYSFVKWWDGNTNAERKYTIMGNVTVSALFIKNIAVTIVVPQNGSIELEYNGKDKTVTSLETQNVVIDVVAGSYLKMTAIADLGYHFVSWNSNTVEVNPYTFEVTDEMEITVLFDKDDTQYEVRITNPEATMGIIEVTKDGVEINSGDKFTHGTILHLNATEVGEYKFIKWWDNSTEAERDLILERNVDISALFQIITYTVTIEASTGGSIVVKNGEAVVNSGDNIKEGVVLTLSNAPATGYKFKGYLVDEKIIDGNSVIINNNTTIAAQFEGVKCKINMITPEHCHSMTAKDGVGNVIVDGTTVPYGTVITVSTLMEWGYKVSSYTADGVNIGSTLTVTTDVTISANVILITFKITIYKPEGGVVTVKNGDNDVRDGDYVDFGSILTLSQATDPGYTFSCFTVDGRAIEGNQTTRPIETAMTISGQYEIDSYAITLPTVEGATVAVASGYDAAKVRYGSDFKFKVILKSEYSESQIVVKAGDELLTAVDGTYTIINITGNKAVTITGVVKNTFTITIQEAENGIFTVKNGDVTVKTGDKLPAGVRLTLEGSPATDYQLKYFTVDGFQIYGKEIVVEESITISALFEKGKSVKDNEEFKASVYAYGKVVYVQSEVGAAVAIFDMSGRVIMTSTVVENMKTSFDLVNAGTYVVILTSNGKVNTTKVVAK